jgi:hypothetical protein
MTGMPKEELIFQSKSNELLLSGLCDFIDFDYEKATLFSGELFVLKKEKNCGEKMFLTSNCLIIVIKFPTCLFSLNEKSMQKL